MEQDALKDAAGIQMLCTQGAPLATPALGHFPSNVATIRGAPGTSVYASLSCPALFDQGDLAEAFFTLDPSGCQILRFRCDAIGADDPLAMDLRAVTFAAYPEYQPDKLVSTAVVFGNYRVAAQPNIWCYGYATGAMADGVSPCSIYVILEEPTNQPIKSWNLALDNGARVPGLQPVGSPEPGTTVYNIPFSNNGFGATDVVCDRPATVKATITLPDSNDGDLIVLNLMFLAAPVAARLRGGR